MLDANEPFDDTDANGEYLIANINPPDGDYSLREQLTRGRGHRRLDLLGADRRRSPTGRFPCAYVDIDASDDPVVTDKDFGNYKKPTIIVEKQTVPDGAAGVVRVHVDDPGQGELQPDRRPAELDRGDAGRLHGDRDACRRAGR